MANVRKRCMGSWWLLSEERCFWMKYHWNCCRDLLSQSIDQARRVVREQARRSTAVVKQVLVLARKTLEPFYENLWVQEGNALVSNHFPVLPNCMNMKTVFQPSFLVFASKSDLTNTFHSVGEQPIVMGTAASRQQYFRLIVLLLMGEWEQLIWRELIT